MGLHVVRIETAPEPRTLDKTTREPACDRGQEGLCWVEGFR